MVDVTRHNFATVFPQFESDLKKCSYVSLDCEFSHLPSDDFENSFFDDGPERYLKIRNHLHNTVILQVGLSLFTFMRDLKKYNATIYRFYIVPRPFGPVQTSLLFKSATLQFLCRNKFDFNKCFYDGISFLNETQERLVKMKLTNGSLINWIDSALDYKDVENATTHSSAIVAWLANSSYNDTYEIPVETDDISYRYFIHKEIRRRFVETWTFNAEDNSRIIVKHVTKEDRRIHELNDDDPASTENLIKSLLGFTEVFKLLMKSKKPLVGHNLLYDLLIMYHQFYQDLPLLLYDTSLGNLYALLQDEGGIIYQPFINLVSGNYVKDELQRLHDAGWDSYFTGFCFIKLGYYLINSQNRKFFIYIVPTKSGMQFYKIAMMKSENLGHVLLAISVIDLYSDEEFKSYFSNSSLRLITFKECMNSLAFLANKISLARAKIPYVNLSGNDPASIRPPILHVCWKKGTTMKRTEIANLFDKYGLIHKKECSSNSMLIATSNYGCYKDILRDFKQHRDIKVERYSLLRHHTGFKIAMCAAVILPVGCTLWYNRQSWFV
ncbi:pre-piRNA 3'-exonuclease trimmer-like isoform X2 [Rhodnius prolixus]|uniref:pre-piRNA 3'-exonuclease trimmer-like isoform X2 n=1 Tax=Rhodnius prolixus TaxID=13249 RepID=UPI003D18EC0A